MMGWLFGGLVKQFERVAKDLVRDSSQEISSLFDDKLFPLADKLDYVAQNRIKEVEELESKVNEDIQYILNTANQKVKCNLEQIDQLREKAIKELRQTLSQTDFYLENRINQMSLAVMEAINLSQQSIDNSLSRVESIENKLFQDANQIIDQICEVVDSKLELIRNELKKYFVHGLPGPFDQCRKKLKIAWKPGGLLSDIELYELNECYELSKLNENMLIDEVLKIYGQLQQNATMMAALVRKSPELRNRAINDWIKYGLLCELWRRIINDYNSRENQILGHNFSQQLLVDSE